MERIVLAVEDGYRLSAVSRVGRRDDGGSRNLTLGDVR